MASNLKEEGNKLYSKKDFLGALQKYSQAVELDATQPTYYSNRAAALFELGQFQECVKDCHKSLELLEGNANPELEKKLKVRLGKALFYLKDFEKCLKLLQDVGDDLDAKTKTIIPICQYYLSGANNQQRYRYIFEILTDFAGSEFWFNPKTRDAYQQTFEYFAVGNERVMALTSGDLFGREEEGTKKTIMSTPVPFEKLDKQQIFRLLFGGAGDPRHLLQTSYDMINRRFPEIAVEIYVNDINPTVLARYILILMAVRECQKKENLSDCKIRFLLKSILYISKTNF